MSHYSCLMDKFSISIYIYAFRVTYKRWKYKRYICVPWRTVYLSVNAMQQSRCLPNVLPLSYVQLHDILKILDRTALQQMAIRSHSCAHSCTYKLQISVNMCECEMVFIKLCNYVSQGLSKELIVYEQIISESRLTSWFLAIVFQYSAT